MAGYSGTPLAKKLGIKPGSSVVALHAPPELGDWLAPLPPDVRLSTALPKGVSVEVVLCFVISPGELAQRFDGAKRLLIKAGGLWIAWPKQAARKLDARWATGLTENAIRTTGLAAGLVDNKVCAISEVWSGLRFVYRLKDR